jgi:hypothetical protein
MVISSTLPLKWTSGDSGSELTDPIPIFVIGMTRSGTKWLSNLFCTNSNVAGVQNERHRGVLETSIFDTTQQKFNLTSDDDFAAFVELWSRSDFFRASGANKELFYRIPSTSRNYLDLFDRLMSDMARRRGCRYWVQKISPHCAIPVLRRFPTARIVIITRPLLDVVRSQAALNVHNGRKRCVAQTVYDYVVQEKYVSRIRRCTRCAAYVQYESLRDNTESTMQKLLDLLGIGVTNKPIQSPYPANTSFTNGREALPSWLEFGASAYAAMLRILPLPALLSISACRRALRRSKAPATFYSGEFGMLKDNMAIGRPQDLK